MTAELAFTIGYIRQMIHTYESATGREVDENFRLVLHEYDWLELVKSLTEPGLRSIITSVPPTLFKVPVVTVTEPLQLRENHAAEEIRGRLIIVPPEHVERLFGKS